MCVWGAGPLQALSAHLPADNSAQAAQTEEILKQLRQMQEQVSAACAPALPRVLMLAICSMHRSQSSLGVLLSASLLAIHEPKCW